MKVRLRLAFLFGSLATIFFLYQSFRFLKMGSILLGEPDEFVHAKLAQNLLTSLVPFYDGRPFFYDLPGYFLASSLVLRLVGDPLFSLRLVSFFSTIALGFVVFTYLKRKNFSFAAAVFGVPLYYLNPFTVFYSQVGLIEPFLSLLSFVFLFFYDSLLEKTTYGHAFFAGLFLFLVVLTKYSGLYFLAASAVVFLGRCLFLNYRRREDLKGGLLVLDINFLLVIILPIILILPLVMFYYFQFPLEFKEQTRQALGLTSLAVFRLFTNLDWKNMGNLFWWFTPYICLFSSAGFVLIFFERIKAFWFFLFSFLVLLVLVFSRAPFHPRYLVSLLPYLSILAAVTFEFLNKFIFKKRKFLFLILLLAVFGLGGAGSVREAFDSSKSEAFRKLTGTLDKFDPSRTGWVLSNYWPNLVGGETGRLKYAWLTLDNREIRIFQPDSEMIGEQIMKSGQALVVIEEQYASELVYSPSRYEALLWVKKQFRPVAVVNDPRPNFPFFKRAGVILKVYQPSTDSSLDGSEFQKPL